MKILTGSTDESGAFLRWAQATFGITRATIALTPASASFVAERLANLSLEIRLIEAPPDRPLHAKFYWFEGADGPAAVMGSANCSAAAWLLAPESAGNVESIVAYDRPDAQDFESALGLSAVPGHAPADILVSRTVHDQAPATHLASYAIKSLQWNNTSRRLIVEIFPAQDPAAKVGLRLGERVVPMER
ncbi:MAG: phospholipase D family protein [Ahniella sp.]|nr:phospholipase D family protein [Ahniella sp.]